MTGTSTRHNQKKIVSKRPGVKEQFIAGKTNYSSHKTVTQGKPALEYTEKIMGFDPINLLFFAGGIAILYYFTTRR